MRLVASRARRLLLIAALGSAVTLSACTTTGTEKSGDALAPSGSSVGQFPVTIATAFGDVTIPKQPQRVVALGWSDAETALALGVQPVGQADWLAFGGDGQGPWNQGKYTTPPAKLGTLEVDMEAVAALNPDIILDTRASGKKERYDLLSGLGVPVVDIPAGGEAYLTTWEQQLEMVGKALGKSAEAAQLRDDLVAKFGQAAAANPTFKGKTVVVGARSGDSYGAYVNGGRTEFMERLGFTNAPEVEARKGKDFFIEFSNEQLNLFDADLTVLFLIGAELQDVKDDALFQAVPSVKAGHVVYMDDKASAMAFSSASVLGLSYAVDKVTPLFPAALAR